MMNSFDIKEQSLGYQQLTNVSASTGLTEPSGAVMAIITPEGQAIRWRDDGTAPTATVGYPLAVGAELRYTANQLGNIKFIEQAASAKVNIVYYGK